VKQANFFRGGGRHKFVAAAYVTMHIVNNGVKHGVC